MIQPLEFITTVMLKVADISSIHEWIFSHMELQLFSIAKTGKAKRREEMVNGLGQMILRYFLNKKSKLCGVSEFELVSI